MLVFFKEGSAVNLNYLFEFTTLLSLVLISVFVSLKNKRDLSPMSAMMVAMVLGMSIGVSFGLVWGAYLQGNLLLSTIFSVWVGGLAGVLIGAVYGILPAVEGFFTGLMSGMMGAMLAEMIPSQETRLLLKIFVMLIFCSIALVNLIKITSDYEVNIKYGIIKPIILIVLFISYLVTSDLYHNKIHNNHPKVDGHKLHQH